jgi:hyaluronoglucosaminidase
MAITPDSKTLYVMVSRKNIVVPVSAATERPGKPISVGRGPDDIAVTPNGKTVYVLNQRSASVTPILTATNKAGPSIDLR